MAAPDHATDGVLGLEAGFAGRVRACFGRSAAGYEQGARLQAGVAARLGRLSRTIARSLPPGPRADLGAGSGLLSRALETNLGGPALLRVDQCPDLLAQERRHAPQLGAHQLLWDLNGGLPRQLQGAALLASSFALQWLEQPERQLEGWCEQLATDGWLVLAVPTAASFGIWRAAARAAAVPFSGLQLPDATALEAVVRRRLRLQQLNRLRFSRPNRGALPFLHRIRAIGAQASRQRRLSPSELRRLVAHWPSEDQPLVWEVLLVIGQKP